MRHFSLLILLLCGFSALGQKYSDLDKSPMDLITYKKGGEAKVKVWYGRPSKNGRQVFDKLVKYDKVWRTGANENTEIAFLQDVKIDGKIIKAGTYSLFTIPNKEEWTVIINSDTDKWGHFFYKEKNDVLRVKVKTQTSKDVVESFSMSFDKAKNGTNLYMAWDETQVMLPIEIIE